MSTGVNAAIKKARDAGLYVTLDTPPDPAETVDITFATDNREAGKLDGQWAVEYRLRRQGGHHRPARPVQRQDRLGGLRPRPGLPRGWASRSTTPRRTATRRRPASTPGQGRRLHDRLQRGRERRRGRRPHRDGEVLAKNPNINLVYTINEPTAVGANAALKALARPGHHRVGRMAAAPASPRRTG